MMKKHILTGSFLGLVFIALSAYFLNQTSTGTFELDNVKRKSATKAMRAREASELRFERLKDENGNYFSSYYAQAVKQADMLQQSGNRAGALNLGWEEMGPDNVGGRVRALLIDKRDPSNNTIYAGGVSGGMWKSTNGGNNWTRMTSWNVNLNVACIDQGPAPDYEIYIGTGEALAQITGSSLSSGNMGDGVFKLDANDNPIRVSPGTFSSNSLNSSSPWAAVNRIAINPNDKLHIIAATQNGLWETKDGGSTWDQISIPGIPTGQFFCDVKWDKRDGINLFASIGMFSGGRLVRSRNGGISWERVQNTTNPGFPTSQGRIEIGIAPSNPDIVYISVATPTGCTFGVYRSEDAGDTWTTIGTKSPLFDPFLDQCQGWFDNVITVSPADPNKVYLGGVDFYTWSDLSGWKQADVGLIGNESNPNWIHSDKHAITIADNNPNLMFIGHDGGISRSDNALSSFPFPTYRTMNRGFNVTQFYSVAAGLSGEVMGGTQDNGTQYINLKGSTRMAAKRVFGGDGIYTEISHIDPRIFFAGIYFGAAYRSGNYGSSFDGFYDTKVDNQGHNEPSRCGGQQNANAPFITPFYLSETRNATGAINTVKFTADRDYASNEVVTVQSATAKYPFEVDLSTVLAPGEILPKDSSVFVKDPVRSRFFLTSNCGVWLTSDALNLSIIPKWYRLITSMNGVPLSYSASPDGNTLYVGTSSGRVYKFPNLNSRCDTATYPIGPNAVGVIYSAATQYTNTLVSVAGGRIEGVSVDPNDADHAVAVVAGFSSSSQPKVFETTDGGVTWQPLNGLPNMPVYDVVVHDANTVIVATELGIWSWDGSQWHEENNGIPRMPVFRLIEKSLYNDNCKVIYAGTHGRGIFRAVKFAEDNGCRTIASVKEPAKENAVSNMNVYPNPVRSNAKVSLTLDKAAPVTIQVLDLTGRIYHQTVYSNTTNGTNTFDLQVGDLPTGTYVATATADNRTQSRLFVVSK